MKGSKAEYSMDPVVRAFMEFLLKLGRQAVKDSHQLRDAFTVNF